MYGERIIRGVLGFIIAPAVAAVVYSFIAWGSDLQLFALPFTLAVAYGLTIIFMVPALLIITINGWYSWNSAVALPGIILGLFFLVSSYYSYQGYKTLQAGTRVLVEGGALTTDGWVNLFIDATDEQLDVWITVILSAETLEALFSAK